MTSTEKDQHGDRRRFGRRTPHTKPARAPTRLVLAISLSHVLSLACGQPEPKYQTPFEEDTICITAGDLGIDDSILPGRGMLLLDRQPSVARFPTGVSVVRVKAMMAEKTAHRYLRVADMTRFSEVYWSHLWDKLPPIREVRPLGTMGVDPRGAGYEDLLRQSVEIECELCVMYALVTDTNSDAEFVAVLWDAADHQALATFRTPVELSDELRDKIADEGDRGRWVGEAEFRAEADLRRLLRDAMWDIVELDRISPATQPSPWRDYMPGFPRDYDRLRAFERALYLRESKTKIRETPDDGGE